MAGYDLSNDIGQIDALENGRGMLGMTGLNKLGHELSTFGDSTGEMSL